MVHRVQLAHSALIVVGVALLAAGFLGLGAFGILPGEYVHEIEPVAGSDVPADAATVRFADLSADGKSLLRDAVRTDGVTTVRSHDRVSAFAYGDAATPVYVVTDGGYYRVATSGGGTLAGLDEIVSYALLAFGAVSVLVGGIDRYRHRDAG